jgi:hypothetical protein
MSCLSNEQIDYIRNNLKTRNVSRSFLFEEWIDHVCCDVENLMNKGIPFQEAYAQVAGEEQSQEVRSAHKDVQSFLNHPYVGIKKLMLVAFLVFAASWVINIRYGSNWIGLASFLVLSTVYLRISMDFFRKRFVSGKNILFSVFSFLSFLGSLSGILMIFLNRNFGMSTRGHGVDLTVFGWFFFSLVCLMYYTREFRSAVETNERRKIWWFIVLAIINVFLASVSIASFPLYRQVQSYIFYLILLILGFNLVAILFLLSTRSMKNTLILSLVLGSFMIVFIHSHFRHKLPGGQPKLYELTLQVSPEHRPEAGKLFISMYFDRFPDKPITLPLNKSDENHYSITMPSYPYRGYLIYGIETDSIDAREYFRQDSKIDSVALNIPKRKTYQLNN